MTITGTNSIKFTTNKHKITLDELMLMCEKAKDSGADGYADVTIQTYTGDQRDPGYTTLTITWTVK